MISSSISRLIPKTTTDTCPNANSFPASLLQLNLCSLFLIAELYNTALKFINKSSKIACRVQFLRLFSPFTCRFLIARYSVWLFQQETNQETLVNSLIPSASNLILPADSPIVSAGSLMALTGKGGYFHTRWQSHDFFFNSQNCKIRILFINYKLSPPFSMVCQTRPITTLG